MLNGRTSCDINVEKAKNQNEFFVTLMRLGWQCVLGFAECHPPNRFNSTRSYKEPMSVCKSMSRLTDTMGPMTSFGDATKQL